MRVINIFVCFLMFSKKKLSNLLVIREIEEGTARLLAEIKSNRK